jgi:hypothetical protein
MLKQRSYRILALTALVASTCLSASAQRVDFLPPVDSIFVVGSCTPPTLMILLQYDSENRDTVSLIAPYNDPICTGYPPTPDNRLSACYFIIHDSLDQYRYAMSLRYESETWNYSAEVPFDTPFGIPPGSFTLTLYVLLSDSLIDSLGARFHSVQTGLGVEELSDGIVPPRYTLRQNYPNPFNPSTTMNYELPKSSHVMLRVYNTLGQEVTTLVDATEEPGYKSVEWNAAGVTSGVYFYRLKAGEFVQTRKLLLLK